MRRQRSLKHIPQAHRTMRNGTPLMIVSNPYYNKEGATMLYPKIGIRPVIDGRWGGVRESLENQTVRMRRNAQLKIALDLSMGRERFNCQENCKVSGRGVTPRGQPPAEYGCRSKAAAPTKTTALWMVCCAALAGAGCQRRCKPHIRSGTRRQTASGCKCFPKR